MAEQPPTYGATLPQPGFDKQSYPPPQQGYAPPQQGYAPYQQGYAPPPQGYAPPQQGYAPPPQGYAPQPQMTQSTSNTNTTVVVAGGAPTQQTIVVHEHERFADKICLNIVISLFFFPWIIVWIIMCIVEK